MIEFHAPGSVALTVGAVPIGFDSPDSEYGGGGAISILSGDGTRFWAGLVKRGRVLMLCVYHVAPDGRILATYDQMGILGKGAGLVVQGDGTLEAQGYTGYGDNQTIRSVPLPRFVPFGVGSDEVGTPEQVIELPAPIMYPNESRTYTSNTEVIGPGLDPMVRMNEIVETVLQLAKAIEQLQRLAKRRGDLR